MYYRNEKFDTVLYRVETGDYDTYKFNYDLGVWQDITPDAVDVNVEDYTPLGIVPPFSYDEIDYDGIGYVMWPGSHPDELREQYHVG